MVEFYYTGLIGTAYRRHNKGLSSANPKKLLKWLKYVFRKNEHLLDTQAKDNVRIEFKDYTKILQKKILQHKINIISEHYNNNRHLDFLINWINLICIDHSFIRPRKLSTELRKNTQ